MSNLRADVISPLRNQSWSYPYLGERRSVFFTSDDAGDLQRDRPPAPLPPGRGALRPIPFVGYGRPFALRGRLVPPCKSQKTCPPVWIGVVGNHGIYPVHVDYGTPCDTLCDRNPTAEKQGQIEPDDIYSHVAEGSLVGEDPVESPARSSIRASPATGSSCSSGCPRPASGWRGSPSSRPPGPGV